LSVAAEILPFVVVCVCSVWVPCVVLPSGGGSSAGSSPLCRSPMGGVLPSRVPVSRGICSSSCLSLALTLSQCSDPLLTTLAQEEEEEEEEGGEAGCEEEAGLMALPAGLTRGRNLLSVAAGTLPFRVTPC